MQRGEVVPSTPCGNCKPARYRQNGIQPDGCVFTTCGRGLRGSDDLRRDNVGFRGSGDIRRDCNPSRCVTPLLQNRLARMPSVEALRCIGTG